MTYRGPNGVVHQRASNAAWLTLGLGLALVPVLGAATARGQSFLVTFNFAGGSGQDPTGSLISDSSGNLYGTTIYGGANGYGAVFELPATGGEVVLYSFKGGRDGANPEGGALLRDSQGNLYGVASAGGNFTSTCPPEGCGVVFRVALSGEERVIYAFSGGSDGSAPVGGLTRDAAWNLYGTAAGGGDFNSPCGTYGCGVVFEIKSVSQESSLYTFTGASDGYLPMGGLIRDAAGNLYGTAEGGGTFGSGVVFSVNPTGGETVLYSFTGGADGLFPISGVIRDTAGNLYGTAPEGGNSSCFTGCGLVFKIDQSGNETTLYSFVGGADGYGPSGGLLEDEQGNLYGTTAFGGSYSNPFCATNGCGVVFKLTSAGRERVLHSFGWTDGSLPVGRLMAQGSYLYGTTELGGSGGVGDGVAFMLKP